MKTFIGIGDPHCRKIVFDIIDKNLDNSDKIILLGDYLDPYHDVSNKKQIKYLEKIIDYKKRHPEKFILLLGNHDIHYIHQNLMCVRYNHNIDKEIQKLLKDNWNLFQISFQYENHLFTHAGVCYNWLDRHWLDLISFGLKDDYSNMSEILNKIHKSKKWRILHDVGNARTFSYDNLDYKGGVTWCDIIESKDDYLKGLHQYVGHSKVDKLTEYGDEKSSITYCDTLEFSGEYLILKFK